VSRHGRRIPRLAAGRVIGHNPPPFPAEIPMWFKNLQLFALTASEPFTDESLEAALASVAFRNCGSLELASEGWVPPTGPAGETLLHAAGGFRVLCHCRQEKLLPAGVVNEIVAEEVAVIERQQGGVRLPRRDRQAVREAVFTRLLPQALPRNQRTHVVIDRHAEWLWFDVSSRNRAETVAACLREALGSLRVEPPRPNVAPAAVLTRWVGGGTLPEGFALGEQCELKDPADQSRVVRCRGLDLASDEVQGHLAAGMQVTRVGLQWHDRVAFTLDSELAIRGLQFLDILRDEANDVEARDERERFDADFAIMTLELARMLPPLLAPFDLPRALR
jgi:recombination associated protein RdgC